MLVGIFMNEANFLRRDDTVDFWVKEVPLPNRGQQLREYLGTKLPLHNYKMFSHRLLLENADCSKKETLLRKWTEVWKDSTEAKQLILRESLTTNETQKARLAKHYWILHADLGRCSTIATTHQIRNPNRVQRPF